MITYILVAAAFGAAAFVRLAPSDPARWNTDPGTVAVTDCGRITTARGSARTSCLLADDPVALLTRLDSIALATPRTTRLAGSAETGRITWLTRSRIMGYPDYTTAQTTATTGGTRLDLLARQRFGVSDWGVNANRLKAWVAHL